MLKKDFEELNIHKEGVGDYRVNRFRIFFKSGKPDSKLLRKPINTNNFKSYFEPNIAKVDISKRKYNGDNTLKFELLAANGKLPNPHTDYVGIVNQDHCNLTAQTLKRNFNSASGAVSESANRVLPPVVREVHREMQRRAKAINSKHFLAGRRSWVVQSINHISDISSFKGCEDVYLFETAAIERLSTLAYQAADWAMSFDEDIIKFWAKMLENYVRKNAYKIVCDVPTMSAGWSSKGNVSYQMRSYESKGSCESATVAVRQVHPYLWP